MPDHFSGPRAVRPSRRHHRRIGVPQPATARHLVPMLDGFPTAAPPALAGGEAISSHAGDETPAETRGREFSRDATRSFLHRLPGVAKEASNG